MKTGILFPGQGAQFEGMGRDWAEAHEVARETFEEADSVLGFSLSEKCWSCGDEVNRTDIAQPGIFTTGVAILRSLRATGDAPAEIGMCAGLSLGEYTALWAAGSISFADALRLVRLRGVAMQDASETYPSSMVSLMGADEETARVLAELGSKAGFCSVANLNAPGQVIVSGELLALDEVEAHAKEHGVRRTRRLVVAGGFHSECMRPAADRLATELEGVKISEPEVPFVSNVNGAPTTDTDQIRSQLAAQVCSPVLWEKSMRWALEAGLTAFLEPGPGQVLAGLMRKIDKSAEVSSAATPADILS
jgi:[acyl-carrier-protein] S-malonyltransferase